jgi:hypothetical protein
MTPAKATLSSKQGQSSAGSGWTRIKTIMTMATVAGANQELLWRYLSISDPYIHSMADITAPRMLPIMTSKNPCIPQYSRPRIIEKAYE